MKFRVLLALGYSATEMIGSYHDCNHTHSIHRGRDLMGESGVGEETWGGVRTLGVL